MFSVISAVSGPINGAKLITRKIIEANKEDISHIIDLSQAKEFGDFGKFSIRKVTNAFAIIGRVSKIKNRSFVYLNFTPQGYVFVRDLIILSLLILKKCVVTCHIHTNMFTDKPNYILSFLVKNSKVICINDFQFEYLSKFGKVHYLKNTLPLKKYDIENMLDERIKGRTLTFLSNIDMKKGYKYLEQIAINIHDKFNEEINFNVIGGILDPKLEPGINKLHESGMINYLGAITDEDRKFELLNQSYFFLFLSEPFYEAFPLTYIEALSCGLPIITTQQYCTREVIKSNGIIIEEQIEIIGEFIDKCIHDIDYYKQLCQNSQENFRVNFSFINYISDLKKIIYQVE